MKNIWCYSFFITWVSLSKSIGFEYRSSFRKFDPSSVVLPCSCNFYFSYWFVWADCFGMHAFFWFVSCCMMLLSVLLFLCLHFSSEVGKGKRMSKWWMADAISLNSSSSPDGIWSTSVSDFLSAFMFLLSTSNNLLQPEILGLTCIFWSLMCSVTWNLSRFSLKSEAWIYAHLSLISWRIILIYTTATD